MPTISCAMADLFLQKWQNLETVISATAVYTLLLSLTSTSMEARIIGLSITPYTAPAHAVEPCDCSGFADKYCTPLLFVTPVLANTINIEMVLINQIKTSATSGSSPDCVQSFGSGVITIVVGLS